MPMGNFRCVSPLHSPMAAKQSVGIQHVTVVPTNYEDKDETDRGRDGDE